MLCVFGAAGAAIAVPWISPLVRGIDISWLILIPAGLLALAGVRGYARAIRPILQRKLLELGLCPSCGYSLYGNTSASCPECGLSLDSGDVSRDSYSSRPPPAAADAPAFNEHSAAIICTGLLLAALATPLMWLTSTFWGGLALLSVVSWGFAFLLMLTGFGLGLASPESSGAHYLSRLSIRVGIYLGGAGLVSFLIGILAGVG
jgi:hypothetical protein